ncbi:MAG: hypothetical protein WAU45_10545 [Blastocatellia bacterium]
MIGKLMLAFFAILLTAALGLAISQQKPEQKPEQKAEEKPGDSDKKVIKVRTGEVMTVDATKNEITIKDDAGTEARLLIDTFTKITKAGQSITLADLKVGDKISSECAESSDGCKAKAIQVIPPGPSQ